MGQAREFAPGMFSGSVLYGDHGCVRDGHRSCHNIDNFYYPAGTLKRLSVVVQLQPIDCESLCDVGSSRPESKLAVTARSRHCEQPSLPRSGDDDDRTLANRMCAQSELNSSALSRL